VYNTKTETWDQKQELHLFQTKYVKNDSLSTHRKAILQIYLNIERWKDE
jgi:hypothetical protein